LITPAAGGWTEAVRMQITEVSVLGVRSAVVALRHPERPLRFVLIPMVHIAQARFYRQVADRLRKCQLIVAEGYDGPSSVGLAYAVALRVTRQRSAARLVHQDIDYEALGVPVVWPDNVLPSESHWRQLPVVGWLDVALLVPALTVMMTVGGRNWLLRRNLEVSDDTEPRLFLRSCRRCLSTTGIGTCSPHWPGSTRPGRTSRLTSRWSTAPRTCRRS
jgi:hypothetical protein